LYQGYAKLILVTWDTAMTEKSSPKEAQAEEDGRRVSGEQDGRLKAAKPGDSGDSLWKRAIASAERKLGEWKAVFFYVRAQM